MALSFLIVVAVPGVVAYMFERRPLPTAHSVRQLLGPKLTHCLRFIATAQGRDQLLGTAIRTLSPGWKLGLAPTPAQLAPSSLPAKGSGASQAAAASKSAPFLPSVPLGIKDSAKQSQRGLDDPCDYEVSFHVMSSVLSVLCDCFLPFFFS